MRFLVSATINWHTINRLTAAFQFFLDLIDFFLVRDADDFAAFRAPAEAVGPLLPFLSAHIGVTFVPEAAATFISTSVSANGSKGRVSFLIRDESLCVDIVKREVGDISSPFVLLSIDDE